MAEGRGIVYLVGAGPGDPGLLTRRGEALIKRADVIVYDRLVGSSILELRPSTAELVFVGKERGRHALPQTEINQLLVRYASQGKCVVRLKGGDPFVFGRGGEEALELRAAGIPFEIVPGISSAIAAPAYAGIPVTHRGLASSVAVVTGHEDPTKPESAIAWTQLANGVDTLVFLMGVEQLSTIAEQLLQAGRPSSQPAALVRWGTTPEQETLVADLGSIGRIAAEQEFGPPAVLVVGDVAGLARELSWFEQRPLRGKRVLVTRSREQASILSERLAGLGARTVELPSIRIEDLDHHSELDGALGRLTDFGWIVFTSANGVKAAFNRLHQRGRDARAFGAARVAAIGPATARALLLEGIRADLVPEAFTSRAVAEELGSTMMSGDRVLLLRADIAPTALAEALAEAGARVESVVAYRTVADPDSGARARELLKREKVDVVTFTSSSTVRNLLDGLNGQRDLLSRSLVACIGPVTAATAAELGLRVDLVAPVHTIDGLVDALVDHYSPAAAAASDGVLP